MIKYILSFVIIIACMPSTSAKAYFIAAPNYWEDSSKVDLALATDEAVYSIHVMNVVDLRNKVIRYSIDGAESTGRCDANNMFDIATTPGRHIFQFYADNQHYEVYTDSILIQPQQRIYMSVFFPKAQVMEVRPAKPVIYLYPEEELDVTVTIDIKGNNEFLYPNYDDQWSFTAHPNGDLIFGDKTYNYLFWESTQFIQRDKVDESKGFVVEKEEVVAFLEKTLDQAGLSSKQQADFITYWGPQLAQNDLNYVHFIFNEECDEFAELMINPQPAEIYRIYMLWKPLDHRIEVEEQAIKSLTKDGFTVVEWGGMELPITLDNENL